MNTTTINSKLILASKNQLTGDILYTWCLTYPRMILAEFNTHRVFSRNTSSSRAIPSRKQRAKVLHDPFVPTYIGANKKGMQAGEELSGWRRTAAEGIWRAARYPQLAAAWGMEKLGVHKQIANRLVEPWVWTQQVASATEVENFFWLRDHHMAEPHFHELARQMHHQVKQALYIFPSRPLHPFYLQSEGTTYQTLTAGEWHLPFTTQIESYAHPIEDLQTMSAARCARSSYYLQDGGISTLDKDTDLYNRLAGSNPKHLSPLEHQATPLMVSEFCGNFRGWKQLRKNVLGESGPTCYDLSCSDPDKQAVR